jgi:AcrR family transcriptional regulator
MARLKDQRKRTVILDASKMLFSRKGFYNTSVSDIVRETGLPIGTIYTYFHNKEEIISTIVEEGWGILYDRLQKMLSDSSHPRQKLKMLLERFLPTLLTDLDFINILLTEALVLTRIEEKFDKLSGMIFSLLGSVSKAGAGLDRKTLETAVAVYFLGILNTAKLSRSSSIGIKTSDIIDFTRTSIEKAMDIRL